jgi:hypothetical protein
MKRTIIIIILILATAGGTFWYIKNKQDTSGQSDTTGGSFFKDFFSFNQKSSNTNTNVNGGSSDTNNATGEGTSIDDPISNTQQDTDKLKQITDFAVAGFTTFIDTRPLPESVMPVSVTPIDTKTVKTKTNQTKVAVPSVEYVSALRYTARSNGHVYSQYLDTEASAKISNSTIPSIYEAYFGNNANAILYRYLSDNDSRIQTFLTHIDQPKGDFLQEDISGVALSPDSGGLFYLAPLGSDVAGYYMNFKDNNKVQVFTSAFTEWLPQWAGTSTIFLTTKPSWNTSGSVYITNLGKNNFTKLFGGIKGLTTLASNNAANVIYSSTTNIGPELGIYNIENHEFSKLPIRTLADKCVWSRDGVRVYCAKPNSIEGNKYPDNWYKGIVSFNDSIVVIDTNNKSYTTLVNTEDVSAIDAINLKLSQDEKKLFFMNKKDYTLWRLDLE